MNDWDMSGKATKVQEAAAEAILAERERFEDTLIRGLTSDGGSAYANDQEFLDKANPYPADPYSIDQIFQVPSMYLWLENRDPSVLTGKKETVDTVAKDLAMTLPDGIGNLQTLLVNNRAFTGRVPDRFARYLDNMIDVAENQGAMASELSVAVDNMHKLLTAAGDDMTSITDETVTALNAIRDNDDGDSGAMGFAVAGAIIGVAGALTGGTAAIAWALLSGAVSVTATAVSEDSISAPNVEGVLDQMFDAVADRVDSFMTREGKLSEALNDDIGLADVNRYELDPDTEKSNMYDGRGDTGAADTVLALDLSDTYGYATHAVPRLAKQFGTASTVLSGAAGVGTDAMGLAATPWETLCTKLQRYSARTCNHLNDGGETLAKAVQAFARQDGVNAKWVAAPIDEADDVPVPEPYTSPEPPPWIY